MRPNIVLIYADDLGYGDVSCYGADRANTPNIDRLARQGRMFTDAHAASAVCTSSRYCLLTGQYAFRINNWQPVFYQSGALISPRRPDGGLVSHLIRRASSATVDLATLSILRRNQLARATFSVR